jgi:ABC-type branched-subunit amino acid transport system substrate-binding protein
MYPAGRNLSTAQLSLEIGWLTGIAQMTQEGSNKGPNPTADNLAGQPDNRQSKWRFFQRYGAVIGRSYVRLNRFFWRHRPAIYIVGLIIAAVGALVGGLNFYDRHRTSEASPDPTREVRFIFDQGGTNSSGHPGKDVADGVRQALDQFPLGSNISVTIENDRGEKAEAVRLAKAAVDNSRVILVIGHLQSSIMAEVIEIYAQHQMPVIMPVPTNPKLTNRSYRNIFRMPPSDDEQAKVASVFLMTHQIARGTSRGPIAKIAVLKDAGNPVYSDFLASRTISILREARGNGIQAPSVISVMDIGNGTDALSLADRLKRASVDAVFFPGTTDNALTFVEALSTFNFSPVLLMTDGVVDRKFLKKLGNVPDNLFVTFQLEAPHGKRAVLAGSSVGTPACADSFAVFPLSFCPYGYDSVLLSRLIIQRARNGLATLPTRAKVLDYLDQAKSSQQTFPAEFSDYRFNSIGDNELAHFHVWQAEPNSREFLPYKGTTQVRGNR